MSNNLPLAAIGILLFFSGCTGNLYGDTIEVPEVEFENPFPTVSGVVIIGAACEEDSDCVYAENAHPSWKCVSANCPPEDQPQPEVNDPAYEWETTYIKSCVNSNELGGKNSAEEELLINERTPCVCQPFQNPEGYPTSMDGTKLCQTKTNESQAE